MNPLVYLKRVLIAIHTLLGVVVVVFVLWDLYAIAQNHWTFDPERTSGLLLPGGLPIDEVLFFIVIPIASVLTLEAVI